MAISRFYPRHLVQFCEKKKKKKSILPPCNVSRVPKGSQGLLRVTKGYHRLPQVTTGYHRLPQVTTGYHRLPQLPVLTDHYIKLSRCRPIVRMKFGHFFIETNIAKLFCLQIMVKYYWVRRYLQNQFDLLHQ